MSEAELLKAWQLDSERHKENIRNLEEKIRNLEEKNKIQEGPIKSEMSDMLNYIVFLEEENKKLREKNEELVSMNERQGAIIGNLVKRFPSADPILER